MARGPKPAHEGGAGTVLYYEIANFQQGIDHRKDVMTAPAGTMRNLINCHITPGGEIEKRTAFTAWASTYTTPSSSSSPGYLGLITKDNQIYIVHTTNTPGGTGGISAPDPGGTYPGVVTLEPPPGIYLTEVTSWDVFEGYFFISCLGWSPSTGGYGVYSYYPDWAYVPQAEGRCYFCRTYKQKMYGLDGRYLYFSAVGDPTTWQDPPPDSSGIIAHNGSGFVSIGSNDSDSEYLVAMEVYYDKMAIFSRLGCQLWFLDPDPSLNQYYQTLRDSGTAAKNSVRQYVANDVYFLGVHGIRSLRARDLTTTAAVADVGSPLDPIIQNLLATRGAGGSYNDMGSMQTVLSPRTGRVWLTAYDRIYVLSNYAAPNISAWSQYNPGFYIQKMGTVFADPFVYIWATNGTIYRFGSWTTPTYDSCPVQIDTPALSFDKPATYKFYQGLDAVCRSDTAGAWNVQMSFDPAQGDESTGTDPPYDQICQIDGPTTMGGRIPISGRGTHVQVRMTHAAAGAASFGKLIIHYASGETG
jgi:hypothetical protein